MQDTDPTIHFFIIPREWQTESVMELAGIESASY